MTSVNTHWMYTQLMMKMRYINCWKTVVTVGSAAINFLLLDILAYLSPINSSSQTTWNRYSKIN